MVSGASIQAKVWKGYGIAASKIGFSFQQYRAVDSTTPIAVGNLLGTLQVSLNAQDMTYGKPNGYGKALWYGLFDATTAQIGDYLVAAGQGTFFIATLQPLLPILVVECNRTVTVYRPKQQSGIGAQGYGGNTVAGQTAIMTGWPASILQGTKGEKTETALPGDIRSAWWTILLPQAPGVVLNAFDKLSDDLGRDYVLSSVELTASGWRCTAMQAVA